MLGLFDAFLLAWGVHDTMHGHYWWGPLFIAFAFLKQGD